MENYDELDLIQDELNEEELIIDENDLVMNANDGAMDQMVKDAMKKDPLPIVIY